MNRREFARTVGATLPAWVVARSPLAVRRLTRIGLELYSVRGAMRRDPEGTLAGIRAIGYTDVELLWSFGNFGRTPAQVKASLQATGLAAPSAHIAPQILTKDWAKSLDDAKLLGHQYLIAAGLPAEARASLDVWRQWADRFNAAGAEARAAGVWLAFHNEPDHMKPIDGQVPYDLFISRLDPALVRLQLDVGNMVMGNGDPMAYLRRHRDRYWSFHLKDVVPDRSRDTGLGTGIVDLKALLAAVPDIEHKPCFVEQEGKSEDLAAARADWAWLSRLEF
ncbi:MAG: TIM barrel protein [Gemmatimonadaceae bacterium]|nr:TIM barrel protein [Gemmatimonadaceae bacterium]